MSRARSSRRSSINPCARTRISARSYAVRARQPASARDAASMAARASVPPPSATVASQMGAEATVHATAESDVGVDLAVEANLEGIAERLAVDVGDAVAGDDRGARRHLLAGRKLDVLGRHARNAGRNGRLPAQQLL